MLSAVGLVGRCTMRLETRPRHVERAAPVAWLRVPTAGRPASRPGRDACVRLWEAEPASEPASRAALEEARVARPSNGVPAFHMARSTTPILRVKSSMAARLKARRCT